MKIKDTLVNPIGQPLAYGEVYFVAIEPLASSDEKEVLLGTEVKVSLPETGEIDCTLVRGTYRVYVLQNEIKVRRTIGYIKEAVFDTVIETTLTGVISKEAV